MSKDKKLRKQKYRAVIIETNGFIIDIKNRGEYGEYEDNFCFATFEISELSIPYSIYNLNISAKDRNYIISEKDILRINKNIEKNLK